MFTLKIIPLISDRLGRCSAAASRKIPYGSFDFGGALPANGTTGPPHHQASAKAKPAASSIIEVARWIACCMHVNKQHALRTALAANAKQTATKVNNAFTDCEC